jgi:hypothetical protein
MTSKVVKRGPHKKRRRPPRHTVEYMQLCERCNRYARTFPNWCTVMRLLPSLWDPAMACTNQHGGIHPIAA